MGDGFSRGDFSNDFNEAEEKTVVATCKNGKKDKKNSKETHTLKVFPKDGEDFDFKEKKSAEVPDQITEKVTKVINKAPVINIDEFDLSFSAGGNRVVYFL